ncbi:hypothetical protein GL982_10600 (plasmid) [Spiroplasma citri]|uniref:Uncharacterized protein n=1 Tax=Spiroplasma citri TaxID=2133 RepID=A0AAJ4JZ67_SPICI|nr:hypothetical protein [Spiroplasma citri]QIA69852.1 hypothetical protein GL298_10515 [Spiroplasma citri]QIA71847.1 hypothetical protein GL981_11165 [Spiroplasma citri]QIA71859.1 hypothetical protein GL981_11210 [Spiroplasma citri]QIA73993.1 hypothetical protein GL982_10600 [Spiroplasma citri]QIA75823.1 hypothetical protein GTU57_09540 [Spiroplasma citri]
MTNIGVYAIGGKFNADSSNRKETIKINCYEMPHQDILIKWLVAQNDIEHYQTERELKIENGNLKTYPDLIIYKTDGTIQLVEFERTRKTLERFRKKLDGLRKYYKDNYQVHWITPIQRLSNWIATQINNYAWQELKTHEIWNTQ